MVCVCGQIYFKVQLFTFVLTLKQINVDLSDSAKIGIKVKSH